MKKRHFAQRLDVELIQRIETVASVMRATPRTVLELCLFSGLPELEQKFKVQSQEPKDGGAESNSGFHSQPVTLRPNRLFSREMAMA